MKKRLPIAALVVIAAMVWLLSPPLERVASPSLGAGSVAPEISGDIWLNSPPLRLADLSGKVVLVEFWTFACYNCQNVEPHVKDWQRRYGERGLVVIGVHSPELRRERELENVRAYAARARDFVSGRGRQRVRDVESLRQPGVARIILDRQAG